MRRGRGWRPGCPRDRPRWPHPTEPRLRPSGRETIGDVPTNRPWDFLRRIRRRKVLWQASIRAAWGPALLALSVEMGWATIAWMIISVKTGLAIALAGVWLRILVVRRPRPVGRPLAA